MPAWQPSIQRFSMKYYLRSKVWNSLRTTRHVTDLHQALLETSDDSHPPHYIMYCCKMFSSSYSLANKTVPQNEIPLKL